MRSGFAGFVLIGKRNVSRSFTRTNFMAIIDRMVGADFLVVFYANRK